MLVWPFDIVVAAEDATFQDNTVAMGICGAEFFNHPYEFGVRKAKEMLFTSDAISAQEAIKLRRRDEWSDMLEMWTDDPEQAASHMAFGMSLDQRKQARQLEGKKVVPTWV